MGTSCGRSKFLPPSLSDTFLVALVTLFKVSIKAKPYFCSPKMYDLGQYRLYFYSILTMMETDKRMKPQASVSLTGFTRRPVKHSTRPLMTAALLLFTEKIYAKMISTCVLLVVYNVPIVLVLILLSCAYSRLQAYLSCYTLNKDLFCVHYVHICSRLFPIPTVRWESLGMESRLFIHTVRAHHVFIYFHLAASLPRIL